MNTEELLQLVNDVLDEMGYPKTYKGIPKTIEELTGFSRLLINKQQKGSFKEDKNG